MVSELHARKAMLEAKLAEKNRELKLLCIQEAELTGVLPPEIPLEPGESPPVFRRRVGTAFAFPENLINSNKPKFKEDESLSTLELECQIQTGISEAALGLANDGAATKAVRRKHRHLYQQSQRRLDELTTQLNLLRQTRTNQLPKQRKKPRPPIDNESVVDSDVVGLLHEGGISLSPPPVAHTGSSNRSSWEPQHQVHHETLMRHSATHDGLTHHRSSRHNQPLMHPNIHRQGSGGYFAGAPYAHQYSTLATCAHPEIERLESRRERLDQGVSTPGYWLRYEANETENVWFATAPRQMQRSAYNVRHVNQDHQSHHHRDTRAADRLTGSLDRRKVPLPLQGGSSPSLDAWTIEESEVQHGIVHERIPAPTYSHPLPVRQNIPTAAETLLPGQTYPEHGLGLVRTQSLGSVEALKKFKEKEWYETSLDAAPVQPPPARRVGNETGSDAGSNLSRSSSNVSSERRILHTRNREVPPRENYDSAVPLESPKNHTVVQAGKCQPYREVTKPFEMADFYKYSTKFRKNDTARPVTNRQNTTVGSSTTPIIHPRGVGHPARSSPQIAEATFEVEEVAPQQKGVYQPLKPMACSPMDPNAKSPGENGESVGEAFSSEMLAWYQDKSLPRSATLV